MSENKELVSVDKIIRYGGPDMSDQTVEEFRKLNRLPDSWDKLQSLGFYSDLLYCANAAMAVVAAGDNQQRVRNMEIFLDTVGKGFQQGFSRENYPLNVLDDHVDIKDAYLTALAELAELFGDRISGVFWDSLALFVKLDDPFSPAVIDPNPDLCPDPCVTISMLSSLMRVPRLTQWINIVIYERAKVVPEFSYERTGPTVRWSNECLFFSRPKKPTGKLLIELTFDLLLNVCQEAYIAMHATLPVPHHIKVA